jgi:predicted site-specific integrase-resolvase
MATPRNPGDLLKPYEVAMILGVRSATVGQWARAGRLTWTLTPGGHRRYRWEEVRKMTSARDSSSGS